MKASELITILAEHPEYEVEIDSPTQVAPIAAVSTDVFDSVQQGPVFVIEGDWDPEEGK